MEFRTKFELNESIFFIHKGKISNETIQGVKITKEYKRDGLLRRDPEDDQAKELIIYAVEVKKIDFSGTGLRTTFINLEEQELFSSKEAIVKYFALLL